MDSVLAETRVRCTGKLHRIALVGDGKRQSLILRDHRDVAKERLLETLSGHSCRCRDILHTWRNIIGEPTDNITRFKGISYSDLPKPFRSWAKKARAVHVKRNNPPWPHLHEDIVATIARATHNVAPSAWAACSSNTSQNNWFAIGQTQNERYFDLIETRLHDVLDEIRRTMTTDHSYSCGGKPVAVRLHIMDGGWKWGGQQHVANGPTLNIWGKGTHSDECILGVHVTLSDLLRAHIRTDCLARQPDGRWVVVVGIPRATWARPYRDQSPHNVVIGWVVRQWRGLNWTVQQALLRRDGVLRAYWRVDRWL